MAIIEVSASDHRNLQNIANVLAGAKKVIVVTGAGISTAAGIPDFRSKDGLYDLIQVQSAKVSKTAIRTDDSALRTIRSEERAVCPVSPDFPSLRRQSVSAAGALVPLPPQSPIQISTFRPLDASPVRLSGSLKGRDLFDSMIWNDPDSTSVFYRFIASLRDRVRSEVKKTTTTHRFLRVLRDRRQLIRCYTQNIDGLEAREGLSVDLGRGRGTKRRFCKSAIALPAAPTNADSTDGGCEVVQLHGDLETLRCTLCQSTSEWTKPDQQRFMSGGAPLCQICVGKDQDRQDRGKRGTKVGTLRPNVVLYGENHPDADALGSITTHDLSLSPDVLLVLGTSLRVHGLKTLVREFAKSVHARRPAGKGKVIFVNLSRPSDSMWKDTFDYWVSMDCDSWVSAMRRHRPDLFQWQGGLRIPIRKKAKMGPRKNQKGEASSSRKEKVDRDFPLSNWEENKENEPQDRTVASTQKIAHCVLVPETPKKQKTFDKNPTESASASRDKRSSLRYMQTASFDSNGSAASLQLPTPPSSRTSFGEPGTNVHRKRRRTLVEVDDELTGSPSKRPRPSLTIWED